MLVLYVSTAIALIATGVMIGVVTVVSLGIRREERDSSLATYARSRAARGARRLTSVPRSQPRSFDHSRDRQETRQ
jgi:Flp pilus assembly protein protease CpaA